MPSIEPDAEQLAKLIAAGEEPGPIVMINLLRYRDVADYPAGSDAEPCSGREAYQRYGMHVLPMLAGVGGRIRWLGEARMTVIGPEGEQWDEAVLVEYPSRKAFVTMVSNPDYQKIAIHRTAALADSRLIATETRSEL